MESSDVTCDVRGFGRLEVADGRMLACSPAPQNDAVRNKTGTVPVLRFEWGGRRTGMLRIGQGYDIHRLVAGRPLWLGLVEVPFDRGSLGHSDGDVAAHALCDALLSACGAGDMGLLFPSSDMRWK